MKLAEAVFSTLRQPLWTVEFRSFASWDYLTPLMYIPIQRMGVRADTEDAARADVLSQASPGGHISVISVERVEE